MQQDQHAPPPRLHWRDKPLLTLTVTSELINVSTPTLYKLAGAGKLSFKRLGHRTMVETASIIDLLDSAESWSPSGRTDKARRARCGGPQ